MGLCFKMLAEITPLVLHPSERLPGPDPPPIIDLLWLMFSVRFRVEGGRAKFVYCAPLAKVWLKGHTRICESACNSH